MTGAYHPHPRIGKSTVTAQIESLWAMGDPKHTIARKLGTSLGNVNYVVGLIQAHSRSPLSQPTPETDERYVAAVLIARPPGFPVLRIEYPRRVA